MTRGLRIPSDTDAGWNADRCEISAETAGAAHRTELFRCTNGKGHGCGVKEVLRLAWGSAGSRRVNYLWNDTGSGAIRAEDGLPTARYLPQWSALNVFLHLLADAFQGLLLDPADVGTADAQFLGDLALGLAFDTADPEAQLHHAALSGTQV